MTILASRLEGKIGKLSNLDHNWVIFLLDHKQHILDESSSIPVEQADVDKYQYNIFHFLRDHGCPGPLHWIALLINDMGYDERLSMRDSVAIPSPSSVNDLYRVYRTQNLT